MNEKTSAETTFLEAEEAAVKLLDALKRLDEEAEHYENAAGTMAETGASLQALSSAVAETSEKAAEAVEAIRSVGSPAIIDGLAKLNETIEKALEQSSNQLKNIRLIAIAACGLAAIAAIMPFVAQLIP